MSTDRQQSEDGRTIAYAENIIATLREPLVVRIKTANRL